MQNIKIKCSQDAAKCFREIYPVEVNIREAFLVIYLNNENVSVGYSIISIGGLTATLVDIRILLRDALLTGSTSIILCHNHPSGSTEPSEDDIKITRRLVEAGELLGIEVLDHIIVSDKDLLSMKAKNLL